MCVHLADIINRIPLGLGVQQIPWIPGSGNCGGWGIPAANKRRLRAHLPCCARAAPRAPHRYKSLEILLIFLLVSSSVYSSPLKVIKVTAGHRTPLIRAILPSSACRIQLLTNEFLQVVTRLRWRGLIKNFIKQENINFAILYLTNN